MAIKNEIKKNQLHFPCSRLRNEKKEIFTNRINILRQSVFRAEANLSDRRSGLTKSWAKKKSRYLHKQSNSQTVSDKLDNMAVTYRTRPTQSLLADSKRVADLEAVADILAKAEANARAEAAARKLLSEAMPPGKDLQGRLGRNRTPTDDFIEQRYNSTTFGE